MQQMDRNLMRGETSLIHISQFLRVLAKFKIKLSDKQKDTITKLYKVSYAGDPKIINIQSF